MTTPAQPLEEWERVVLVALAGPIAGNWRRQSGRWSVARHEASHAVIGHALGFRVGEVSALRREDVAGFAIVSLGTPRIVQPGDFTKGQFRSDRRNAALAVRLWNPEFTWREILREIRRLRAAAGELVGAHWELIELFAAALMKCGGTALDGTEVTEELSARINTIAA